jgi:hypothetical protein
MNKFHRPSRKIVAGMIVASFHCEVGPLFQQKRYLFFLVLLF